MNAVLRLKLPSGTIQVSAAVAFMLTVLVAGCTPFSAESDRPFYLVDHLDAAVDTIERRPVHSSNQNGVLPHSFTLAGESRIALAPPLGSRLTFPVSMPPGAVLRFGIGVLAPNQTTLPARVEFRILVGDGGGEETVFRGLVRRNRPNVWLDREIELGRWAGSMVRLTLETIAPARQPSTAQQPTIVLWSNPVLVGDRTAGTRDLILISVDCLRADHVGAYGYDRDTTPNIDALAKDGVLFENAVSTAPETLPSHMSMFTGLPPSLHGATKWTRLGDSVPYLPRILAKNGYEVNGVVTGAYLSQNFGFHKGFHRYRFIDHPGATKTVDAALEHLKEDQNQFLLLHLFDAHWPYTPPRQLVERFGPRPPDISGLSEKVSQLDRPPDSPEEIEQVVRLYDAEIAYADQEIGRFIDALRRRNLYESSLIILVGDHGEAFHEHGLWQHSLTLYQEVIRVPLIVKWPGGSPVGRSATRVSLVDLFPTLLAAAGITPPANRGLDLLGLAASADSGAEERAQMSEAQWSSGELLFWKIAFVTGRWKYIASLEGMATEGWPPQKMAGEELYDLDADPLERRNLGLEPTSSLKSFRQRLRSYLEEASRAQAAREAEGVVIDEALRDRLRSLGYLK